jgi:hypothetical protein
MQQLVDLIHDTGTDTEHHVPVSEVETPLHDRSARNAATTMDVGTCQTACATRWLLLRSSIPFVCCYSVSLSDLTFAMLGDDVRMACLLFKDLPLLLTASRLGPVANQDGQNAEASHQPDLNSRILKPCPANYDFGLLRCISPSGKLLADVGLCSYWQSLYHARHAQHVLADFPLTLLSSATRHETYQWSFAISTGLSTTTRVLPAVFLVQAHN